MLTVRMREEEWLEAAAQLRASDAIGQAIMVLEEAVASGLESAALCKELARLCLLIDEVRAFANWCHEAMRIDPQDPEPALMLGRELAGEERWKEAAEALQQALANERLQGVMRQEAEQLRAEVLRQVAALRRVRPGFSNL